jgi:hypothetical protein
LSVTSKHHPTQSCAPAGALTDELIALRYPNGRVHETALGRKLRPGEQFEMYGRTWKAMHTTTSRLYKGEPRTLCVPADSACS